ncbi:MAG: MarR family winged helix-turn-helix transcriptional regulator [Thermovirgaceae bacterium]
MEESFGKWISIIHRNLCAYMNQSLPGSDIGYGPKRFLIEIALFPGLTQEEISERLLMDKTTTARAVKELEKKGYITRKRDPEDRRCRRLWPTEQGKAFAPRVIEARKRAQEALAEGFTEEERARLASLLKRLSENAASLRRETGSKEKPAQQGGPPNPSGSLDRN